MSPCHSPSLSLSRSHLASSVSLSPSATALVTCLLPISALNRTSSSSFLAHASPPHATSVSMSSLSHHFVAGQPSQLHVSSPASSLQTLTLLSATPFASFSAQILTSLQRLTLFVPLSPASNLPSTSRATSFSPAYSLLSCYFSPPRPSNVPPSTIVAQRVTPPSPFTVTLLLNHHTAAVSFPAKPPCLSIFTPASALSLGPLSLCSAAASSTHGISLSLRCQVSGRASFSPPPSPCCFPLTISHSAHSHFSH